MTNIIFCNGLYFLSKSWCQLEERLVTTIMNSSLRQLLEVSDQGDSKCEYWEWIQKTKDVYNETLLGFINSLHWIGMSTSAFPGRRMGGTYPKVPKWLDPSILWHISIMAY